MSFESSLERLRESRRETLLKKAREDKETVEVVNFMLENRNAIELQKLTELLASILPLRCATSVAPRFSLSNQPTSPEKSKEDEQFQESLKQFSKMEMRLLLEVLERMTVLMIDNPLSTPSEIQSLESLLKGLSIHQCSACGETDMMCSIL